MSKELMFVIGIAVTTLAIVIGAALFMGGKDKPGARATEEPVAQEILVRPDSFTEGSESAKVTVVEFSDFECPACKAAEPILKQIREKYRGQIRFVYRFFPLPAHEYGLISAQAAEAAGRQGKFWEMHEKLFANQPNFQKDQLKQYALEIGLDPERFAQDLESDSVLQKVLNDRSDGGRAGVQATPTFFINGTRQTGILPLVQFEQEITARLQ